MKINDSLRFRCLSLQQPLMEHRGLNIKPYIAHLQRVNQGTKKLKAVLIVIKVINQKNNLPQYFMLKFTLFHFLLNLFFTYLAGGVFYPYTNSKKS